MSQGKHVKAKFPILYYEETEPGEPVNPIPYIEIEDKQDFMPPVLFVHEYRHTGEFEPDEKGNPRPIVDMYMHKYVDMELLKEKLPEDVNDAVRVALGMKPLKEAQATGQQILDKVNSNIEKEESNKGE